MGNPRPFPQLPTLSLRSMSRPLVEENEREMGNKLQSFLRTSSKSDLETLRNPQLDSSPVMSPLIWVCELSQHEGETSTMEFSKQKFCSCLDKKNHGMFVKSYQIRVGQVRRGEIYCTCHVLRKVFACFVYLHFSSILQ